MNEDQRQQLVDLIDRLESEGFLSKKEFQSQVDIKKQDFNTEEDAFVEKTLPSQPGRECALVEENVTLDNTESTAGKYFFGITLADNTKNQSIQELKNLVDLKKSVARLK